MPTANNIDGETITKSTLNQSMKDFATATKSTINLTNLFKRGAPLKPNTALIQLMDQITLTCLQLGAPR